MSLFTQMVEKSQASYAHWIRWTVRYLCAWIRWTVRRVPAWILNRYVRLIMTVFYVIIHQS